jgi:Uma2 family endonuclease
LPRFHPELFTCAEPTFGACVLSGEARAVLAQDPDTTVGIDVAVFAAGVLENQSPESALVLGIPLLAVEILSPHDKHEKICEKIAEYLRVGVALVWEVDPDFQTVRVFRPGNEPIMFNRNQRIDGGEVLTGFEVAVATLFPAWK